MRATKGPAPGSRLQATGYSLRDPGYRLQLWLPINLTTRARRDDSVCSYAQRLTHVVIRLPVLPVKQAPKVGSRAARAASQSSYFHKSELSAPYK